ncbi:beta strand repeat-containing protein [Tateyamaria sp. SN3-11]|uniref:beta strand repeat-containing protein n=1 Tax=Tateyamaria sp. SN3-11 TaxID=3092147 RepID=UPI0039E7C537
MAITSYRFLGENPNDTAGLSSKSAGDFDGDGLDDLIIGANQSDTGGAETGSTYLVSAADLESADAADGTVDGVISLENVGAQNTSYQFVGAELGDRAGISVSSVGDIDGDGVDDLFIGAFGKSEGPVLDGGAYLISAGDLAAADAADGSADGIIDLGNVADQSGSYELLGIDRTSLGDTGSAVASAGDVDGDGINELLIGGAVNNTSNGDGSGEAFLINTTDLAAADAADGTVDGIVDLENIANQSGSYQILGPGDGGRLGTEFASVGDIDGDGLDDFLIEASSTNLSPTPGETYFVSGADLAAADAADGTVDGIIDAGNIAAQDGSYQISGSISAVSSGDVDGDGVGELLLSTDTGVASYILNASDLAAADAADGTSDGVIQQANIAAQSNSYQFIEPTSPFSFVTEVASAGDVDGDGIDDILFGGPFLDAGGENAGGGFLLSGAELAAADAADGVVDGIIDLNNINDQDGSYQFIGTGPGSEFGREVDTAGDVDGDGLADFYISAPNDSINPTTTGPGQTFLLSGADLAAADDDGTGQDGIIDLNSIFYDGVVEGTAGADRIGVDYLGDPELDRVDNNDNAARNNDDVIQAGAGDDTIVASLGDDTIDGGTGRDTYQSTDEFNTTSYSFTSDDLGGFAGHDVASAGDVDGDGIADFIISAINADANSGTFAINGETYLVLGRDLAALDADGDHEISLGDVAGTGGSYQFNGADMDDQSGVSISSAGDVDGDGLDDLIIGSSIADGGGFNSGESYLILARDLAALDGNSDGEIDLGDVAGTGGSYQFNGDGSRDNAGISVSSAGDVDGDGLDDLIIGASGAAGGGFNSGESYLILARDLAALDGNGDGEIDLGDVAGTGGSYQFTGASTADDAGRSVSSAGDVDGDGLDDLIIGAGRADGGGAESGESYLILGKDLAALDGNGDGEIDLDDVAGTGGLINSLARMRMIFPVGIFPLRGMSTATGWTIYLSAATRVT